MNRTQYSASEVHTTHRTIIQYQLYLNSWEINSFLDSAHVDVRHKHGFSLLQSWKVSMFHFGTFCINTFSNGRNHMVTLFMYLGWPYKWTCVDWYFYTFLKINTLEHILYYPCLSYFSLEFQDRTDLCKCNVTICCNMLYFLILATHSLSTASVCASLALS